MNTVTARIGLIAGTILILLIFIAYGTTQVFDTQQEQVALSQVIINGYAIDVSVAETPQERTRGLSGTASLAPDTGLLFVFDQSQRHHMWMKDMNYAIDIVWIAQNHTIIDIHERISPDSYPDTFRPRQPAAYALEIPAGTIDRIDAHRGDTVIMR